MMKQFFFSVVMALFAIGVNAQDDSWMGKAPNMYLPKACQDVASAGSPCNIGSEAFSNFVVKFRSNAQFRKSRVRFTEEWQKISYEACQNFYFVKAHKVNKKCDQSFGTWFNVSANEVCFAYKDVLPCDEFGGSAVFIRFQRIDGKWYCTDFLMAG